MRITAPLILGAGPAGCAAAIVLARSGARPLLIDRDAEVGDPLCGGFISWRTAEQLAHLGVNCDELGAQRVTRLCIQSGAHAFTAALPAPAWGLSRHTLDTALRQSALGAGATLEIDTIRTLEGQIARGARQDWTAATLFLASGKHDIRGQARPRTAKDPALGLRLRLNPSPALRAELDGAIELHLFNGGYAGIVLQEHGSANICIAVKKSVLAAHQGDPRRLLADLAALHPRFGARLENGWRDQTIETIGAVPYGWIARVTEPGLYRVGDQAAVIPSLAGEGMSIALASGRLAASGWINGGAAAAPAFQREFARRAVAPLRVARMARAFAEAPALHRPMLFFLDRIPGFAELLMERTRIRVAPYLAPASLAAKTRANPA